MKKIFIFLTLIACLLSFFHCEELAQQGPNEPGEPAPPVVDPVPDVEETGEPGAPVNVEEIVRESGMAVDFLVVGDPGVNVPLAVNPIDANDPNQPQEEGESSAFTVRFPSAPWEVNDIAPGGLHTCALYGNTGLIRCWGRGVSGQLGMGDIRQRSGPTQFESIDFMEIAGSLPIAVYSGGRFSCAVLQNGALYCWGRNAHGQLGVGDTNGRNTPVRAPLADGDVVTKASLGASHICVLLQGGDVKCWGRNSLGELGLGHKNMQTSPPTSPTIQNAIDISGGDSHTCALLNNGEIKCWGRNFYGQLGLGYRRRTVSDQPEQLSPGDSVGSLGGNASSVSAGNAHTCALLDTEDANDGKIKCWGRNHRGQLGLGDRTARHAPDGDFISLPDKAVSVGAGSDHTCALLENRDIYCWGFNRTGQLGLGATSARFITSPQKVMLSERALQLSVSENHNCAILENGTSKCWGYNSDGQLGIISRLVNANDPMVGGYKHSCALLSNRQVHCWGLNDKGQLGVGDTQYRSLAFPPEGHVPSSNVCRFPGGVRTCTSDTEVPNQVDLGGAIVISLAASDGQTCALLQSGQVKCWGENSYGQVNGTAPGDNSEQFYTTPQDVSVLDGLRATSIEVGGQHSCAVLEDGSLKCWGRNVHGMAPSSRSFGDQRAVTVTAGLFHTCVLLDNGAVNCFGAHESSDTASYTNNTGSMASNLIVGFYQSASPDFLPNFVISISAGRYSTHAVLDNGEVRSWGRKDYGVLGRSATSAPDSANGSYSCNPPNSATYGTHTPTTPDFPSAIAAKKIVKINASQFEVGLIASDGSLIYWGQRDSNVDGTCQNRGSAPEFSLTIDSSPDTVTDADIEIRRAIGIGGGIKHFVALLDDSSLSIWGTNDEYQLGIGFIREAVEWADMSRIIPAP